MNSVRLDCAGDVDQIPVDHGHDGCAVFGGEIAEDLVELMDIVRPVVGRQSNAGEQHFDVRIVERCKHGVEVVSSLIEGKASESIITAEFNDDDCWMQSDDGAETDHGIFTGGAARSLIGNVIVVAELVEVALKRVWVGLAGCQAVSRGDAIAITNEQRPIGTENEAAEMQEAQ